jgi:hypothetical protein
VVRESVLPLFAISLFNAATLAIWENDVQAVVDEAVVQLATPPHGNHHAANSTSGLSPLKS